MVGYLLLGIIIGAIGGFVFTFMIYFGRVTFGTLRIDRHDPDKDIYRYDIRGDIADLPKKKKIVLRIDPDADLSQD